MNIEPFRTGDIATFLTLGAEENWVAEQWEFAFLLSTFPQGCFVARLENGETLGFVTSLHHDRSGWIGNLIVADVHRGNGIGDTLFTAAFEALRTAGVETFWLTASKSGLLLYQKHGFIGIDTIGFITLQPCGGFVQFGPFSAVDSGAAERLFEAALRNIVTGTKVFADAPASNRASLRFFNRKRMKIVGSNLLMYAGKKPNYRPELIYGLATMGSCG